MTTDGQSPEPAAPTPPQDDDPIIWKRVIWSLDPDGPRKMPFEILTKIVDLVCDDRREMTDLAALGNPCKTLFNFFQPILYRDFKFDKTCYCYTLLSARRNLLIFSSYFFHALARNAKHGLLVRRIKTVSYSILSDFEEALKSSVPLQLKLHDILQVSRSRSPFRGFKSIGAAKALLLCLTPQVEKAGLVVQGLLASDLEPEIPIPAHELRTEDPNKEDPEMQRIKSFGGFPALKIINISHLDIPKTGRDVLVNLINVCPNVYSLLLYDINRVQIQDHTIEDEISQLARATANGEIPRLRGVKLTTPYYEPVSESGDSDVTVDNQADDKGLDEDD
ncbi:hypothetical protein B0T22DRAFT_444460 [Podospora appendiculata]|uniref:Uncharacterized protein n=1 Tax=Podospora appendiculata TaxID=314037 RepID=A0AAE0X0D3_9PEZI|nr:hypothetical protein B0T22DRAFT_444460 [Podospora appendiculata]